MRTLTALALSAAFIPGVAFAAPDCGNPPVKTAEAVYTIKTPQQAVQDTVTMEPSPASRNAVETVPVRVQVEPEPPIVKEAQMSDEMPVSDETKAPMTDVTPEPAPALAAPVTAYSKLLERRITRGEGGLNLFDYAAADKAGELTAVTAYTDHLSAQNPDAMAQNDQIAYWANLYNALTLKVVLENYPVSSIREIKSGLFNPGPWDLDATVVNGKTLTLNDIEHGILRKKYPNPSFVHYMVNCASIGCPNLSDKLWNGSTLDADRKKAAKDFINSPRGAMIKGDKLKLSSIYDWFKEDFGGSKSETLKHLREFAGPDLAAAIDAGAKIDGYDYDWSLNQ